jgi:hypothetical protein
MKLKATMRTLTISAFLFLGVAGAAGTVAVTHAGQSTPAATTVLADGGAGNG